jgi:Tol biopolymer transport system component
MGPKKRWWVSHSPDSYRLQYYVIQNSKSHEQDFTFNMNFWLLKFEDFLRVVVLTFPFNSVYMNASKGIYWHQDFRLKTER